MKPAFRFLRQLSKQIAFRATLISILSVILALLASALAPLIPYDLSLKIGADAVDNILTILASSMLAVTTFSMTAMVTAFNGSAQNVTPRATQLLIEDSAAQNALSTFLGGFLFGIVGIIALSTGWYGAEGRAVLFIGTILMIAWIVFVLLRWIQRLTSFGRMQDTIERVEAAVVAAIDRHEGAILAGRPAVGSDRANAVVGGKIGFVTEIDSGRLGDIAGRVQVCAPPGTFVDPGTVLARTDAPLTQAEREEVAAAFALGTARDFRHDPGFGFIVLSEIASRALSPAVNDPGSAIAVLAAGRRLVHRLLDEIGERDAPEARVGWAVSVEEMVEDLVRPIVRDGAKVAEVGMWVQRLLGAVASNGDAAPAMRALSDQALAEAAAAGMGQADLMRVRQARDRAFADSAG